MLSWEVRQDTLSRLWVTASEPRPDSDKSMIVDMTISAFPSVDEPEMERANAAMAGVVGDLNRDHARLVEVVAEALKSGAWAQPGIASPTHWLVLRAGLSRSRAAVVLAVAGRRTELPATVDALGAGELSLEQVQVIAKHVPAEFEESVADLARFATVPQLTRATAGYGFSWAPAGAGDAGGPEDAAEGGDEVSGRSVPDDRASAPASLTTSYVDGRFQLRFDAPAADGAVVEAALREAKDALFTALARSGENPEGDAEGGPVAESGVADDERVAADDRSRESVRLRGAPGRSGSAVAGQGSFGCGVSFSTPGATHEAPVVSLADALLSLAARSLAGVASASRRAAYRVYVHLSDDGGWLNAGPRLPRHVVEGLTCEGVLQPVWEREGVPVNVGRSQRIVPDRTRRLVLDRDRGCRFPGCGARGHLDVHHIVHWLDGGPTDLDNLVGLCPFHHDARHRGEYTLTGDPNRRDHHPAGLVFRARGGWRIRAVPPPPRRPGRDAPAGRPYAGPTGEPLHPHWVTFTAKVS